MICSYQKHIDALRTVEIRLTEGDNHQRIGTELATIDGTTYIYLPDDAVLPAQPAEISVATVEVTPALQKEISAASPHVRLINSRVVDMIRERYSMEDELKLLRLTPSDESSAYSAFVEGCRTWGHGEKAKLGL